MADIPCLDFVTPAAAPGDADRGHSLRELRAAQERDAALVSRLLQRDADAWQAFLRQYQRLIYSRVLAAGQELGATPEDDILEDCCAEILATLFRNDLSALRTFRGASRLSTWLAVVSRRVALNYLVRRQRDAAKTRQPGTDFDMNSVAAPKPTRLSAELDCPSEHLQSCLEQLSPPDRQVLELHFQRNFNYRAIAAELGISENAVGPKLSRAQQRLRQLVDRRRRAGTTPPRHRKQGE